MDENIELNKLAEECGELIQIAMKVDMDVRFTGIVSGKKRAHLLEEMGDVLCHLKRAANVLGIGWDELQQRSAVKNEKVNKYYYGGKGV